MAGDADGSPSGHLSPRQRPADATTSALEDIPVLGAAAEEHAGGEPIRVSSLPENPYQPTTQSSRPALNQPRLTRRLFGPLFGKGNNKTQGREDVGAEALLRASLLSPREGKADLSDRKGKNAGKHALVETSQKLGTYSGVFVPTTLNTFSILMFLRFGFILGQSGFLGMMGMLIAAYAINLVTTMSISAIATNGTVRGGGAYYLISRSLGAEFGGSIGIVFYLGLVFNTGMNAVGLIDCFNENFGTQSGSWVPFLQESFWWSYLWATVVLVVCTIICLAGSSIFVKASHGLLFILLASCLSIPMSAIFMKPFKRPELGIEFTGLSVQTLMENLKPHLTKGAAGSQRHGKETVQDLFGILFPATGGIFAGASMSGNLKDPSRAIPRGTLSGLALTFVVYTLVILGMAASITRDSFYRDANIIQDTNFSRIIVLLGEFASSFFSCLLGVIGSAKLLQAISRDNLLPGLSFFGQGTKRDDEPTYAIILTFIASQLTMLFDINQIASLITMTYLMTFLITNLACFLLRIGSAPNFRPSFRYFNSWTAGAGALISGATMFYVDGFYAAGALGILLLLFLLIHYTSPPKSWGDVSQSLIYHQVRKYLLRLRQEHVKFWRPQILLFVDDFESQNRIIHFCNSIKKGGLFILGKVIVADNFTAVVPEARRQQHLWAKFVEYSKVKAFVHVSVHPQAEWGVRNVTLSSGLGGMRPNIVVLDQFRGKQRLLREDNGPVRNNSGSSKSRRTDSGIENNDSAGFETLRSAMDAQSYLTVLEDLLFSLRINVAVARGFENLELPNCGGGKTKQYIDLWPIQMSAELSDGSQSKQNILTSNFDTYTLILQLGCILNTVPSWKKSYKLRVIVFVEYETDVEEERGRVQTFLDKLRIQATVLVFWLACGELNTYRIIVNGDTAGMDGGLVAEVETFLNHEEWWGEIQNFRDNYRDPGDRGRLQEVTRLLGTTPNWPEASFQQGRQNQRINRFDELKSLIRSSKRRQSVSSFRGMGVNFGMRAHRLSDAMVDYTSDTSDSSSSDDDDEDEVPYTDETGDDEPPTENAAISPRKKPSQPSRPVSPTELDPPQNAAPKVATTDADESPAKTSEVTRPQKWPLPRLVSSYRFSSTPMPETTVSTEEGLGPSIMFANEPDRRNPAKSVYSRRSPSGQRHDSDSGQAASGFPSRASVPLSFDDLPGRAQHLILNELMVKQSRETAVIFTTLPSPAEGTCTDKEASEAYLNDMDALCKGLPPCLLVHSNSMTVTMNL